MKRNMLITNYLIYIVAFLAVVVSSSPFLDLMKYYTLVILGVLLFVTTVQDKKSTIFHNFNFLYLLGIFGFVIYAAFFKGYLYSFISMLFFLASLMALAMGFYYKEKKQVIRRPQKPVVIVQPVKELIEKPKPVVRKVVKKVTAKVAKKAPAKKKAAKKSTKKVAKKAAPKKTPKKVAPKKATGRKLSKKEAARLARIQDANLISFEQDHEVAYVLRKNGKRITKANKDLLKEYGKKFKANSKFKPHNRAKFDTYMKTYKVLKKLESK